MHFVATQRCPKCRSAETAVSAAPPKGDGRSAGEIVNIFWECRTCGHRFTPSDRPNRSPVLMCGGCRIPTPHDRACLEQRRELIAQGTWSTWNDVVMLCQVCKGVRVWGREYPVVPSGRTIASRGQVGR
jgi:hypothetical protein